MFTIAASYCRRILKMPVSYLYWPMMKYLLTILTCLVLQAAKSQVAGNWITPAAWNMAMPAPLAAPSTSKKLAFYGIAGMQAGLFNYASFSAVAVKPLTKNWFAFGGLTAATPYTTCTVCLPGNHRNNLYQAQGGLMYVNDAKTFSVSGSIKYGNARYPVYGPAYYPPASHQ